MKRNRKRSQAFTLVELLIAISILTVVMTALLSLTRGTLRFAAGSSARATTLEALADAEGYLSDSLRNAKGVYRTWTLLANGESVVCQQGALAGVAGRCLAVAAPVVGVSAEQPIVNFDLKLFVVRPLGSLYASDGLVGRSNTPDTLGLLEFRVPNLCGATACSDVPALPALLSAPGTVGVVLTGLSPVGQAGETVRFLDIPDTELDTVELTLVARARTPTGFVWVAQQTPIPLQVVVR